MKVKGLVVVALMTAVLMSVPTFVFSSDVKDKNGATCEKCVACDAKDKQCKSCDKCDKGDCKDCKKAMHDKMIKDLNLTPAQADQMKAHRKAQMDQMQQLHKSMQSTQEALRVELDKPNTDMAALEKLTGDLKSIEAKKIDLRTQGILDVKKILAPEQFCKMCEKMKKDFKKMKGKMGEDGKDEAMEDLPPPPPDKK